VWFSESRGLGLDRLTSGLYAALWKPAADAVKAETGRLRHMTEVRDLAGLGIAAATFKQQADGHIAAMLSAKRAQEALEERNRALQEQVRRLQEQLDAYEQQRAVLEQSLAQERQNHEHTRVHLKDDYEQLRTRLLRRLKAEVSLLTDGLHALRRDPPKTHVMDDHAERVLDGFKKEIRALESGE
jgi:chromosome segregation ATPase